MEFNYLYRAKKASCIVCTSLSPTNLDDDAPPSRTGLFHFPPTRRRLVHYSSSSSSDSSPHKPVNHTTYSTCTRPTLPTLPYHLSLSFDSNLPSHIPSSHFLPGERASSACNSPPPSFCCIPLATLPRCRFLAFFSSQKIHPDVLHRDTLESMLSL